MGRLMAAEFTVAVGDLSIIPSADHVTAYAGLAPVPRDSGKRSHPHSHAAPVLPE
jgi:transposase